MPFILYFLSYLKRTLMYLSVIGEVIAFFSLFIPTFIFHHSILLFFHFFILKFLIVSFLFYLISLLFFFFISFLFWLLLSFVLFCIFPFTFSCSAFVLSSSTHLLSSCSSHVFCLSFFKCLFSFLAFIVLPPFFLLSLLKCLLCSFSLRFLSLFR